MKNVFQCFPTAYLLMAFLLTLETKTQVSLGLNTFFLTFIVTRNLSIAEAEQ